LASIATSEYHLWHGSDGVLCGGTGASLGRDGLTAVRRLPDLEGLAIFAKVAQLRSFVAAAAELNLSKATVSKAIARLESRLKARLFNRTSRRLSLTDAGHQLAGRAAAILSEGEAAEDAILGQAAAPRGLIRLAAPVSFGVLHIAPLLPEFFAQYPDIVIDLQMNDAVSDLVGEGFDAAIRIAALPDSSLIARTLRPMPRYLVGAPSYFKAHGRPRHPLELAEHQCIAHVRGTVADSWYFTAKTGESASVRPSGCLRANNGDVTLPVLRAGLALGILPEFFVREDLASGALENVLPEWGVPAAAVHWVTPAKGLRPRRVEILGEFFANKLSQRPSQPSSIQGRVRRRRAAS
jgi:DNA-binding transcriptional LysR family regulator